MSISTDRVIKWVGIAALVVFIMYISLLVFGFLAWKGLRDDKYYEQIDFTAEEVGIISDVLGVQDDIIIPRSLLTSYEEDYHPVELLFSVEEGKGEEFETYIDTYYECIKASEYAEGIYYQGQEYREKYIYNLVSYWGEEPEEPSIGMEAYESVQGETLYLWWDKDCDDELLLSMPKGGGDLAKITKEQSQGNEYPLQEYK